MRRSRDQPRGDVGRPTRRSPIGEVINLVRPLVAVSWLVSGLFEAYDGYPRVREDVLTERVSSMNVAQEVRRTHPFVPFLATRATRDLSWRDVPIPDGTLIVLDVWGTNHDPQVWRDPGVFEPASGRHADGDRRGSSREPEAHAPEAAPRREHRRGPLTSRLSGSFAREPAAPPTRCRRTRR